RAADRPVPAVAVVDVLAVLLGVRVGLGLLLRDPLVEGLAELLLERGVAVPLADRPLPGGRVPLVERLGQPAVVAHAVAVTLGLVLVVDAVAAVGLAVVLAHSSTLDTGSQDGPTP